MKIRLGYACISETIEGTSSSTYSYTKYTEEKDVDEVYDRIVKELKDSIFELTTEEGEEED